LGRPGDDRRSTGCRVVPVKLRGSVGRRHTARGLPDRLTPLPAQSLPLSSPLQQAKRALGGRLREIRTAAGLTQRDLARLTGWHSSKASRIEYGKQMPSEDDIKQ